MPSIIGFLEAFEWHENLSSSHKESHRELSPISNLK